MRLTFHMRRIQLFEFGDQPWLPSWIRDAITEHLARLFMSEAAEPVHVAITEQLAPVLARSGETHILDLCSGAGGPFPAVLPRLDERLGQRATVTLTDLYPNRSLLAARRGERDSIAAERSPVDARSVPQDMPGLRTMFNAVHHFPPVQVAEILRSATHGTQPIVVIEPYERRSLLALRLAVGGLRGGWRDARRYRGRAVRVAGIHVLLPVTLGWDGAVSVLRAYTANELLAVAEHAGASPDISWRAETVALPQGCLTVLVGEPTGGAEVGS